MFTKPQDIIVALALCLKSPPETYADLARALGMSASEVHACVRRLSFARLVESESRSIRREALLQFLLHGVPYAFPAQTKEITRGLPTAWAAPVMAAKLEASDQMPPVWPDPEGIVQGVSLQPLYHSVPKTARNNSDLYDLLALVDAIRIGRARERAIAASELKQRLLAGVHHVEA
ncbi:AsnC family protein [Opitutaceae bacterium TAV4]|nr:AsnC family protein [Opitutaceae bacterium TAV4]RRK00941.1 AsnC family protein [Opitutaceae bacterium TAV3]